MAASLASHVCLDESPKILASHQHMASSRAARAWPPGALVEKWTTFAASSSSWRNDAQRKCFGIHSM